MEPSINTMTAEALAAIMPKLEELDNKLGHQGYYLEGTVVLWHGDQWSPGYLTFEDGFLKFVFEYKEREQV